MIRASLESKLKLKMEVNYVLQFVGIEPELLHYVIGSAA